MRHACDAEAGEESGQAAISIILFLSFFLLGVMGFGIDLTNIWFHRQAATAAADAACQAGAMDMLALSGGLTPPAAGFTVGTAGNCVSNPAATMCTYAAANGYSGAGVTADTPSNSVSWTFPQTVSGVTPGTSSNPFLKISIAENVKTFFSTLLTHSNVQTINVSTTCGITSVKVAPPMVVLNPTISGAFTYSGGGTLDIVGGPGRGLQVNSSSATAVAWTASGIINLSAGGPNQTGSDIGIVGGPSTDPTNGSSEGYNGGTTGTWRNDVLPVPDPFGSLAAPTQPAAAPAPKWVQYGTDGCPDHSNNVYVSQSQPNESCLEYSPGYYSSGISFPMNYITVIFAPGLYYLNGSLTSGGSNTLRNATPSGSNATNGATFYFSSGSLNFSGGTSGNTIDKVPVTSLTCDGSTPSSALGLPSGGLSGNVLLAPCTQNGTYFDSYGDTTDSAGTTGSPGVRGLLVFQGHSDTTQAQYTGSGALAFSGTLYMHSSSYSDVLTLNGGASTGTYILGEIIVDQVNLSGSGAIKLALNPQPTVDVAKVSMFN
jgi:hypothetical protein